MLYKTHYESPLGDLLLTADAQALTGVWFDGQKYYAQGQADLEPEAGAAICNAPCEEEPAPLLAKAKRWLDIYFAGKEPVSRLNLWLAGHTHRYSRSIPGTAVIAAPVPPKTPHKDGRDYCYPVFTVAGPDAAQPIQASAFRIDAEPGKLVVSAFSPDGACFEKIELADDGAVTERISLPHFDVPADERKVNDPKN